MRYLKMILLSFLVFFSLFTLIGLLFPSNIKSVNGVVVGKRKEGVLKELEQTSNWIKWYPVFQLQAGWRIADTGNDSALFISGKKEMLLFNKRADANSFSFFTKYNNSNITEHTITVRPLPSDSSRAEVTWYEKERLNWYPWDRFRGLVLEKAKVAYLDTVLNRLKQYIDTISAD